MIRTRREGSSHSRQNVPSLSDSFGFLPRPNSVVRSQLLRAGHCGAEPGREIRPQEGDRAPALSGGRRELHHASVQGDSTVHNRGESAGASNGEAVWPDSFIKPLDTRRWVRIDSTPPILWKVPNAWIWVGDPVTISMVFNQKKIMHRVYFNRHRLSPDHSRWICKAHKDPYYTSNLVAASNHQNYWVHRQNYLAWHPRGSTSTYLIVVSERVDLNERYR
jgi:hypothetical protein